MANSNPQTRRHLPSTPLTDFVSSVEDSKLAQAIAEQSVLPHSHKHKDLDYLGENPSDVGTSRCVGGTNISSHPSLPCLTNPSGFSDTVSMASSSGCRALDNSLRVIAEDDEGSLVNFPALRFPRVHVLPCPFDPLQCPRAFQRGQVDEWITHSLEHFVTEGPRGQAVEPPTSNPCPFCEATFYHPSGITSWNQRMRHVADHHRIGHTLSHARPDFALYRYMWQRRVIDSEAYRHINGNWEDRSRFVHGQPSPPITRSGSIDGEEMRMGHTVVHDNRREIRRRTRHA